MTLHRADISTVIGTRWDALVMGAGPSGAMAACSLSERGLNVLLIDRQAFPRKKVCGGCLSAAAVQVLENCGLSECLAPLNAVPIDRMDLRCGGARIQLELPSGLAVTRAALDMALVQSAIRRGATFIDSTVASLGRILHDGSVRRVHCSRQGKSLGAIEARVVIVACGLNRGCLGDGVFEQRTLRRSRIGLSAMVDCEASRYLPGRIHMAVGRGGYVGLTRVEDGRLNIAAAMDRPYLKNCGEPTQAVRRLLEHGGYPDVPHLEDAHWQGTGPLTTRLLRPVDERVLVLGDAAGYIEPFTGEGMTWALTTGAAIWPLVQRAQDCWDSRLEQEWVDLYGRLIQRRQRWCKQLAWLLRRPRLTGLMLRTAGSLSMVNRAIISRLHQPAVQGLTLRPNAPSSRHV